MKIHWLSISIACILIIIIIWIIVSQVTDHYDQQDPKLHQLKRDLDSVHPKMKHIKLYKGKKSYTINKDKIYLCLHDQHGEYYDDNMLKYVLLHEFVHKINEDIGHTPKWKKKFEEILKKAADLGIYDPTIEPINDYCIHND